MSRVVVEGNDGFHAVTLGGSEQSDEDYGVERRTRNDRDSSETRDHGSHHLLDFGNSFHRVILCLIVGEMETHCFKQVIVECHK